MIRLIGPGGAGKSTIGALLAERLNVPFLDLDRHFAGRLGDISEAFRAMKAGEVARTVLTFD